MENFEHQGNQKENDINKAKEIAVFIKEKILNNPAINIEEFENSANSAWTQAQHKEECEKRKQLLGETFFDETVTKLHEFINLVNEGKIDEKDIEGTGVTFDDLHKVEYALMGNEDGGDDSLL